MYFPGNLLSDATDRIKLVYFVINNNVITSLVERSAAAVWIKHRCVCVLCLVVIFQ
jgi:hypothetical protein